MAEGADEESFRATFQNDADELCRKELLQNLNTLRHEDSLCDVTLVVEGREFRAHRNVLAASSRYFRNMFTSDMREKTESKVTIEALTSSVMEDLLTYLYTGTVEITKESSARELLSVADYLIVPRLNKMAGDCLLKNLSLSTCISIYQLAVITRNEMLRDGTLRFINKHFVLVAKSEDFVNLCVDEVIEWVSSDDIEIRSEDEMFEVVINWVEHSPDRRKDCLLGLLRHVRLTLMTPRYLHSKVLKNGFIKENQDCMELVLKNIEVLLSNQQDGSFCEKPRKCLETHIHCLLACGGYRRIYEPSHINCCFVPDEGKWYRLENMMATRTFHAVSCCQGFVYTLNGLVADHNSNEVERFDPTINSWARIAPSPIEPTVEDTGVTSLSGLLYVCGGGTGSGRRKRCSKKVFAHNPKTNTWQECASIIHGRAALCAVATNQYIYAIGGEIEEGATDTVQRFDPGSNIWMLVSSMTEKRKFLCGVTFKNKIFVFGGTSRSTVCDSAEMYDIGEDQWQSIPNMQVPRTYGSAAIVQGVIYVIGGNWPSGSAPEEHKRMIECYDPSTGQWAESKGSFPCQEFEWGCACCAVMIPKNLLKSLPEFKCLQTLKV